LLDADGAATSARLAEELAPDELGSRLRARFAATLAAHLSADASPYLVSEELEIVGPLPRLYARSIEAIEKNDESAMSAVARQWERAGRAPMNLLMRLAAGGESRAIELEAIQLGLNGLAALAGRLQGRSDETPSIVIDWWRSGPDTDRARLAASAQTLELAAGSTTCVPAGYLRSIDKGVASIWQGASEDAPTYAGYPACTGDLVGAGDALQGTPGMPLVIRAITDVTLTEYSISSVGALAEKSGSLALDLGRQAAVQLRRSTEQIADLATQSADVRLARCLLSLAERIGRPTLHGDKLIDAVFTNADLAAMIGSQRARVNRFLTELRKAGAITEFKRKIVIADTAALREFAKLDADGHELGTGSTGSQGSVSLAG
jgi:CRP-like cAMP-binding protein